MLPSHIGRQGADRRISEKHHNWYIAVHAFVDHVLYSNKRYGITPNFEKIIVDADAARLSAFLSIRSREFFLNSDLGET